LDIVNKNEGTEVREDMKRLKFLGIVIAMGFLTGSCMLPPYNRLHLGSSVRTNVFQQIADHEASDRLDASWGLEGRPGEALMERYYLDFEVAKPETAPTLTIKTSP
jgi:hypothetical protein